MTKVRMSRGYCTEGGTEIPPGDYTAVDIGEGKVGLHEISGQRVFTLSLHVSETVRQLLSASNVNTASPEADERKYLNNEYALALTDLYVSEYRKLKPDEQKIHRYTMGLLMNVPFQNRDGWPVKNKDGSVAPTKKQTVDEAKKIESLLFSRGFTQATILKLYRDGKKKK